MIKIFSSSLNHVGKCNVGCIALLLNFSHTVIPASPHTAYAPGIALYSGTDSGQAGMTISGLFGLT